MNNTFIKYFCCILFVLSGFTKLYANSIGQTSENMVDLENHIFSNSKNDNASSDRIVDFRKLFAEITESEELEENTKKTVDQNALANNSISAVFFYAFYLNDLKDRTRTTLKLFEPTKRLLCKSYIQFEVFRI